MNINKYIIKLQEILSDKLDISISIETITIIIVIILLVLSAVIILWIYYKMHYWFGPCGLLRKDKKKRYKYKK